MLFDATDYSKKENWFLSEFSDDADYDVIFLYASSAKDATNDRGVAEINVQDKNGIKLSFDMSASMLTTKYSFDENIKKSNYKSNVFIPYYRQIAFKYLMDNHNNHDFLLNCIRNSEPLVDLCAAFDYYFNNYNKDGSRPFVLLGVSQGAGCLQVLLEEYFIKGGHKKYLKNMVAMYSIGFGVSKKWFEGLDKKFDGYDVIHLAKDENDINCVISWNLEGPNGGEGNTLLSEKNDTYVINPLNWKIDETPAYKGDNMGILLLNINPKTYEFSLAISNDESHKYDAKINLERGSLITSERPEEEYVNIDSHGKIWGGKSLHFFDCMAFYVNIGRNFLNRLKEFSNK